MKFKYKRASAICKTLVEAYQKKRGIYARLDEIFPEFRPVDMPREEYADYLFFANVVNYNADATSLFKNLRDSGFKLNAYNILENQSKLESIIKLRFPGQGHSRLINAAKEIKENWGGNPMNLFEENLKKTYENIGSIHGYGHKLTRMIVILYAKHGFYHPKETEIEEAVDLHTVRIAVNNKMIELEDKAELAKGKLVIPISKFFKKICKKNNLSGLSLHESIWALGSTVCTKAIMKSDELVCKMECPIEEYCDKTIYTARKYDEPRREKGQKQNGNFLVNRGNMKKKALNLKWQ